MSKRPDSWEDPPEDDYDEDDDRDFEPDCQVEYADGPVIDRDCAYWERVFRDNL